MDELFDLARRYRSGPEYEGLLKFIARFHHYSPFNAMLVHIQKPGARYVLSPSRWQRDYRRSIRSNAQSLVILRPGGPVMFVFDVSDTEPLPDAPDLPRQITNPFQVERDVRTAEAEVRRLLDQTISNAKRDGVRVQEALAGSQRAGSIRATSEAGLALHAGKQHVPLRYELLISNHLNIEDRYATLVHELAHLYCGHLGTFDPQCWPDRRDQDRQAREFEAESVCYAVCRRRGLRPRSDEYLSGYLRHEKIPSISLGHVMKAIGLIEEMGQRKLPARPQK